MFDVRGFPTIKYINGTISYTFMGDRTVQGLVTFAQRANGPAVKHFKNIQEFEKRLKKLPSDEPFFFLVKPANSILEETFLQVAEQLRIFSWFFSGSLSVLTSPYIETFKSSDDIFTEILVFKDSHVYSYPGLFSNESLQVTNNKTELYHDIILWTLRERQPGFPKLSNSDWWEFASNELLTIQNTTPNTTDVSNNSSKSSTQSIPSISATSPVQSYRNYRLIGLFVIDQIVEENFPYRVLEFGRTLALKRLPHIIRYFQLAWTNDLESLEDLAMGSISLPNFVILDPVTQELFLYLSNHYSSYSLLLDEGNLINFLMLVNDGKIKGIGGNTISIRLQRLGYNFLVGFSKFLITRPLVALLVLGVPALMFSGIIYLCCCLDASYAIYDDVNIGEENDYSIYNHKKKLLKESLIEMDHSTCSLIDSNSTYLDTTTSNSSSNIHSMKTSHSPLRRRHRHEVSHNSGKQIQIIGPIYSKEELKKRIDDARAKQSTMKLKK
ncbi:Protein disulfide-isomerase TMX3 isoform 2 [Schistosoma japonicum]|uniref:Protein disulfide-isomerase TMX3 isoform 2 n=1 Tax=Schistosoma japonicum TaxID=6182 RepID=A0A4Z2DBL3_SCHJA|nr:Protein disulfide-isomerase TMX3 isoform 2 [Schistosoma japonicum]